ncbi:hypothetical protein WM16_17010 [Burkholderia ubonensis]|uniref:Uncharacterized protein n=1 Tax=Burkholderia ubonensis TaxID=101571 RepID=A0A125JTK6_9BURK|nr:hypothetical protein WM16_17010 [Burkholderia ubonensis]
MMRFPARSQYIVGKLCQGVIGGGVFRHRDRAHEASMGALQPVTAIFLAAYILLFLSASFNLF